jgi:MFS transporter, FHS family, Na+ dependent glucose transporter 1
MDTVTPTTTENVVSLSLLQKKYISFSFFGAFFCLGLVLASLGPCLLDLAAQTGSDIESIGSIFAFRAFGYLSGSTLGGVLYEKINGNYLICAATFICMIGTLVIPFSTTLGGLCASVMCQGFAMGFLDTGGNLLLLRLHAGSDSNQVDPYMQAMHFSFALGALIIPLIMVMLNDLKLSFIIIAIFLFVVLLNLLFISIQFKDANYAKSRAEKRKKESYNENNNMGEVNEALTFFQRSVNEKIICICAGLTLFIYVGAETSYGGLIYTYTNKIEWNDSDGKGVTAIYWGGLAIGRLVAIPLSTKFSPNKLLAIDLLGCLISSIIFIFFSTNTNVIWVMSFLHGFCYASIFPAVLNAAALCIHQIDGISTSIIIVGASIGDMTIPALAAYVLVALGTATFPIIILCCSIGCCVFFSLMFYFGHREEVNLDHSASASKNESKSSEMMAM